MREHAPYSLGHGAQNTPPIAVVGGAIEQGSNGSRGTNVATTAGVDPRVERLQRCSVGKEGLLPLAGGLPAEETFPRAELTRAAGRIGTAPLQYDWPEGRMKLRQWVADRLALRGVRVSPEDVLLTSGAQQALDLAVELRGPAASRIEVPRECYPGALELFRARGAELVLGEASAEVVYAMPALSNPLGRRSSVAEREALLRRGAVVLEDDAYAELCFDGRSTEPVLAAARDQVFYAGTLSKTLCPGLRIGWLIVPPALRDVARQKKQLTDVQGNTFAQALVETYLEHEDYDARLGWLRALYRSRAEALMQALKTSLPNATFREPEGGFSLWLETDRAGDAVELLRAALRHGVSFDPGNDFRPLHDERLAMRLAFSSLEPELMSEAVRRLARALDGEACGADPVSRRCEARIRR